MKLCSLFLYPCIGMDRFHFFFKQSFRYKNDDEKIKTKQSFLKTIVFNGNRFKKNVRFQNIRFKKDSRSLTTNLC